MILASNDEQDQTICHIRDNFGFFAFGVISPSCVLVFEFDFLSLLCNTKTLWNILMMLGTNVQQDEMMCCLQE